MQPGKHIFWYLISFQVEEEKKIKNKIKSLIQTGGKSPKLDLRNMLGFT